MNRTIQIALYCMVLLGCFTACESSLEEEVFSDASPNAFFTSKGDVTTAINGIYDPIQRCCGGYSQGRSFVLNTVSDEGSMQASTWGNFDRLIYSATSNNEYGNMWSSNYLSISAANFVLDNAEKIMAVDDTDDGSFASAALGEAAFMRAHAYFDNVRVWGGVPLRTSVAKSTAELDLARATEAEVYAQIIEDFEFAVANLPEMPLATGRPGSWAAKAYLAKVHLTRQDFSKALSIARDIVTNGPYALQASFADVFDVGNENNAEVIFDIQYTRVNQEGSRMVQLSTGNNTQFAAFGRGGWGLQYAEPGFFEKFSDDDDRKATTFSSLEPHPINGFYYYGKWRDPQGVSVDGHENNFITYRYADLLLILAETINEVEGPNSEAYNAINSVRERAGLPPLEEGLDQDEFRDAVFLERHLELALEQHRWFDLKRSGRLEEVLTASGRPWNDRYLLFPIGQPEMDVSDLLEQNPGY